jgi:hypothetical protein
LAALFLPCFTENPLTGIDFDQFGVRAVMGIHITGTKQREEYFMTQRNRTSGNIG